MFMQFSRWVTLGILSGIILLCAHGVQAKIIIQDGMEGVTINPLIPYYTDGVNMTYTLTANNPSPFTSMSFGTSTTSGLLSDNSTTLHAPSLRCFNFTGVNATDWVHLQFDFRPVSGGFTQFNFWAGENTFFPLACDLRFCGSSPINLSAYGRKKTTDTATNIVIPNITFGGDYLGDWYHVDVLLRPSSWSAAYRTYDITVTQNHRGVLTTGSLMGILQEDVNPIAYFYIDDWSGPPPTGSMQFDNLLLETLNPTTLVDDGVFESPQTNILSAVNTSGNATYTSTTSCSTIANQHFTTDTLGGDLNDNDAGEALCLTQNAVGPTVTDYVHAQFDFKPVSGTYSQWSFVLADTFTSPYAFDLRFNGASLAVYGRKKTTDTPALINIPNVTVSTNSWYHVDVTLKPACLNWSDTGADRRTYDVRVTQYDGTTTTIGEMTGMLNEDSGAINCFRVYSSTAASIGHMYVDNIQIEALSSLAADTELRYGYLPSFGANPATNSTLRTYVLSHPSCLPNWQVQLIKVSDGSSVASQTGTFPFPANGLTMNTLPKLTTGTSYKVRLTLTGNSGASQVTESSPFTHTDYAWKSTALGNDDVIIPPFTAMGMDNGAGTVSTVLRTHTMSNTGLWSQVCSETINLLTGPMRLEVVSNGGSPTVAAGALGVMTKSANSTSVTGSATWSAGPINNATTNFTYDYDGMMKVTVNLPTTTQNVDSLKLIIPLKDTEAKYYHEVTDELRDHKAAGIPAGSGWVWDSSSCARTDLPAPFVPYIWVGGPERGICWFAENDKDWIENGTNPVLELDRNTGEVDLVVKLINQAQTQPLTRTRSITFGLMATPAKPMPSTPMSWRAWWPAGMTTQSGLNFKLAGSCYYWGAQAPCIQFYPAFRNNALWDEFQKSRLFGTHSSTFFNNTNDCTWMNQFKCDPNTYNTVEADGTDRLTKCRQGVNWSFSSFEAGGFRKVINTATVVQDGLEGTRILPLTAYNLDANATWTLVTDSPSPFSSAEFPVSTTCGELNDQSVNVTPYVATTGFGFAPSDWVHASFDVCPIAGSYDQWCFAIGEDINYPYSIDLRMDGGQFEVFGRRTPSPTPYGWFYPNPAITITPGNWYHVDITFTPSGFADADRKYDLTITKQNVDGSYTSGTLCGILQEDTKPINMFRCWHYTDGNNTRTGTLKLDNLLVCKAKPGYLIPYTNSRGINWSDGSYPVTPAEVGTFLDEWSVYDVADPRWKTAVTGTRHPRLLRENAGSYNYNELTGVWYEIDPLGSYQNMALYNIQQMCDKWADGVYFDDCFLKANYNPAAGPGYLGDDGKLHAGVNIFAHRNLIKRVATMQYMMGQQPIVWPHMTNCNIVPLLSFGTMNLDWEWLGPFNPTSDYNMDCQDRFGADTDLGYVVAATGLQDGNVPVILDEFADPPPPLPPPPPAQVTHVKRTALAVCFTHEIKFGAVTTDSSAAIGKLAAFGYGQPDCTVYRYWDTAPPQPVTTNDPAKMLVLKRPNGAYNKAYVIIGDFNSQGTSYPLPPTSHTVTFTIDPVALGLPAGYTVTNDEPPATVTYIVPNTYSVTIPRHEFALILIQ